MLEKLKCTQCGATAFDELPDNRLRCQYCQTLYVRRNEAAPSSGAHVIIGKGAKVVFGASAKVVIRGGLEIEDGADVQINGSLELVEPGDPVLIQQARDRVSRGD
ncbi:MAG: hypothetical protein JST54_11190 [Deltaproteobacteria bacterium]|nr:hypothetical protein [Deltaproteobacteria bacterium]